VNAPQATRDNDFHIEEYYGRLYVRRLAEIMHRLPADKQDSLIKLMANALESSVAVAGRQAEAQDQAILVWKGKSSAFHGALFRQQHQHRPQ
jgi:hypothetical protein